MHTACMHKRFSGKLSDPKMAQANALNTTSEEEVKSLSRFQLFATPWIVA